MSTEKSNRSSATKTLTSGKWGLQAQSFDKLAQPRPLSSEPPMPRRWMSSSRGTGRGSHQSKQRTTAPRVPTVGTLGSQAMRKSCSSSPYTKKYIYIYRYNIYTHIILQRWLDHQVVSGSPVWTSILRPPSKPPSGMRRSKTSSKSLATWWYWWKKSGEPVEVGSLAHYLQGFLHSRRGRKKGEISLQQKHVYQTIQKNSVAENDKIPERLTKKIVWFAVVV